MLVVNIPWAQPVTVCVCVVFIVCLVSTYPTTHTHAHTHTPPTHQLPPEHKHTHAHAYTYAVGNRSCVYSLSVIKTDFGSSFSSVIGLGLCPLFDAHIQLHPASGSLVPLFRSYLYPVLPNLEHPGSRILALGASHPRLPFGGSLFVL